MGDTKIEWTDKTWSPVTGCTKVSSGCKNCWAERMSKRLAGRAGYPEDGFKVTLHPGKLEEPLKWKKPSKIFVCSMGDLFHKDVPDEFAHEVFGIIRQTPQHTYLILTKRPERMRKFIVEYLCPRERMGWNKGFYSHVMLGVSVEDQKTADERIPLLLQTPAAKRFVSYEPAIGPVDFSRFITGKSYYMTECEHCGWIGSSQLCGTNLEGDDIYCPACHRSIRGDDAQGLDWIIMGGESGPGARPLHPEWARSVRDQCAAAGIPYFFKQWGEYGTRSINMSTGEPVFRMFKNFQQWVDKGDTWINGGVCVDMTGKVLKNGKDMQEAVYPVAIIHRVGKKAAGCLLDGKEYKNMPGDEK